MSAAIPLKCLTVAARGRHSATVIFVHGLGDSGHGWKPVVEMLAREPALHHVKWVLPNAPMMSVTGNMGATMPSWFDIFSFGTFSPEDEPGMLKTSHSLNQLISAEVDAGVSADHIVLGGFSQGGTMSLLTGLTSERKLAGIVVLSGWLPLKDKFKAMVNDHVKKMPIFWGHGESDPMVKFPFATRSVVKRTFLVLVEYLKTQLKISDTDIPEPPAKPIGLSFHSYPGMQHSTCEEELADLRKWLSSVVPQTPDA
ncbi:hypothetical protein EUX98_g2292 [Antrodiella citrinella]|uniref:Acyl-protein thioesterase 1 n=1 Tax=Antrodiella citrinella TaxID=2447956 RepID=A0A4S4MZF8_9APHY|nr:hypothetical protein EUX98_g2292 [Antrodiella citrinella]